MKKKKSYSLSLCSNKVQLFVVTQSKRKVCMGMLYEGRGESGASMNNIYPAISRTLTRDCFGYRLGKQENPFLSTSGSLFTSRYQAGIKKRNDSAKRNWDEIFFVHIVLAFVFSSDPERKSGGQQYNISL